MKNCIDVYFVMVSVVTKSHKNAARDDVHTKVMKASGDLDEVKRAFKAVCDSHLRRFKTARIIWEMVDKRVEIEVFDGATVYVISIGTAPVTARVMFGGE